MDLFKPDVSKSVCVFLPVIDVIALPRGGLVERGERVVLGFRGRDQAGDGLLQGGVERVLGLVRGFFGEGDGLPMHKQGRLGEVQEAVPEHRLFVLFGLDEVDGRRGGPFGPVFEEGLGEQVRGREGAGIDLGRAGEEAGPGRGFQPPRAERDGRGQIDGGGFGQAGCEEMGDEGLGLLGRQGGVLEDGHEVQDAFGGGQAGRVGQDGGEFRIGQGDLAQPGDDLAQAVIIVIIVGWGGAGVFWDILIWDELELGGLESQARKLVGGGCIVNKELEFQWGQAPAGLKTG